MKTQTTNENPSKLTFLKVLCHLPKKSQIHKEVCSSFPCEKKNKHCSYILKIPLYALIHQLVIIHLVLVRSLGSWFQFKISFENQTYPRDFP